MVDKLDDVSLRILKLPADFPREEILNIFGKEIFNTNEVVRTHEHNDKYNAGRSFGYITFNDSNAIKKIFNDRDEFEHYFTYKSKQICVTVQKKPSSKRARIDANNNEQTQSSTTLQEPSLKRARLDQNNSENTRNSPILHESNQLESTRLESTQSEAANIEILRLNNEILRLRAERLFESYFSMKSSVENFLNEIRLNETNEVKSNQS